MRSGSSPVRRHADDAGIGHVRVDRGGAETDQYRHVVRVARGAGFDHDIGIAAAAAIAEAMMHRAGGKRGMHGELVARKSLSLSTTMTMPRREAFSAWSWISTIACCSDFFRVVAERDDFVRITLAMPGQQVDELLLRQDRRADDQPVRRVRRLR